MIRKSILSVLGGTVLASVLSFGVSAKAQCGAWCPDRIGNYYIAGCIVYWHFTLFWPGVEITEVDCQYTEGGSGGDPTIAE
jgi:hypothetical protein